MAPRLAGKRYLLPSGRATRHALVTMRCYRRRDANGVAIRRVQPLAAVGCSGSFGGTTGARLSYLCHTVFAASSAAV